MMMSMPPSLSFSLRPFSPQTLFFVSSSPSDVNSRVFPSAFSPQIQTPRQKKRGNKQAINNMLPAALNRKPCRRALVLFLVMVIIPFSGRMFYAHKLEFARRVSLRLEEARREQNNALRASSSSSSSSSKMHTFQNEDDDDEEKREQQKQQQQQLHEDEEKRLLEGNPLGDV